MQLTNQLDAHLLDLVWSLWTELGVAGVKRNHQEALIWIEELLLFTSVLSEIDPRLRDESLDWCAQFHRFISVSRLNSLKKEFEEWIKEPFSVYAATLNSISSTNWSTFIHKEPLHVCLSGKSVLRPHASAALLNIRARSIFGTGARADLITFFLVHPNIDFSISDAAEIGYSKRNLAEMLDDLHFGGLFSRFMKGNQQRYQLNQSGPLLEVLTPIPQLVFPWRLIFKLLLALRTSILNTASLAESSKVVAMRNCLDRFENSLEMLGKKPPPFKNQISEYWESLSQWLLEWSAHLARGIMLEK
jgi:hypothetical protein